MKLFNKEKSSQSDNNSNLKMNLVLESEYLSDFAKKNYQEDIESLKEKVQRDRIKIECALSKIPRTFVFNLKIES